MRSFVLGLVATLALLAVPTPALAHASVESSDPADGATLSALPQTVSVTLNEEIGSGAVLRVLDSSGTRLDDGEVTVAGRRVLVGVRTADAQPGAYRLVYRVVSADGHAVSGQVGFTLSADAGAPEPSASAGASGSPQDDVTITEVEDEPTQKWAPLWVLGFLVISSALIVYIVKAGLTSADGEDEA
ncbi:copper resistance CopC family protein [Aeromicrobium sp. 50.2.37]|uniref:copper resistance CopC family protein n=1 Tax=Aeromicrobium sp. 50.2.37 TaxID=2969305 RepID=UPI00214FD1B0|nr:copper resistance CopC family protein [Aeromicrobium sp. 50.2.37]MCR4513226.1 copper resistance protein CopC [Aeromicrobium sp. 50.2.37]